MQTTTILNTGNTTLPVSKLPVSLMQPIDEILNLLCINELIHKRENQTDHIAIKFDCDMVPELKRIFNILNYFQFALRYFEYNATEKKAYLIITKSKALQN